MMRRDALPASFGCPRSRVPPKWWVGTLFFGLTVAAYVQRTAISVAAARMMPEEGLSQAQIGALETAFLLTYTTLQYPGSVIGQSFGGRACLTACFLIGTLATLIVPMAPALAAGGALFAILLAAQLLLGAMQAPVFGVGGGVLERWFPARQWAVIQGLMTAATGLGSAITPLAVVLVMERAGWRAAVSLLAIPVLALTAAFGWYVRDDPRRHDAVQAVDLLDLRPASAPPCATLRRMMQVARQPNVLLLGASYGCMNVVFYIVTYWSFLYLVQARHFALIEGGMLTALPALAGAAGAALGGVFSGKLAARLGARRGYRVLPLTMLPASGLLLLGAVQVGSAAAAVAGLCLSFTLAEMTEASFWAAAMEMGQNDAAATCGILNTGGNVGGIVATPLVAVLSGKGDWNTPFLTGTCFAFIGAALWLAIDADRHVAGDD